MYDFSEGKKHPITNPPEQFSNCYAQLQGEVLDRFAVACRMPDRGRESLAKDSVDRKDFTKQDGNAHCKGG